MVYLKSFIAGIAPVVAVLFLCIVILIGWGLWISHTSSNEGSVGAVGYDISSPYIGIPILVVVALIFFGRVLLGVSKSEEVAEHTMK